MVLLPIFLQPSESVFGPVFRFVLESDPTIVAGFSEDVEYVIVVDLSGRVRLVAVRDLGNLDVTCKKIKTSKTSKPGKTRKTS
jgi:hypothetical protein